ncbi:hypothetical protein [Natrinema altunense]|uniref:Uncharacterized protein n=1 Tax=Natrinema altunense (strain JCM 12890 / CGMCC 1.3731 / AJ2) TaxID=1227494 RepID=L9ZEB1_NATA2|nr:hypothetical protein [Natrinema altunense]ELY84371.1 hypothetical protein C485_15496 [Natrinema altunense JCM 12890]
MAETGDSDEPSEACDRCDDAIDDELIDDIDDGAGCVEIWRHLSEGRDEE